jgi:hypothetical protein
MFSTFPAQVVTLTTLATTDYSGRNKNIAANLVSHLAQATQAVCVATISEIWTVRARDGLSKEDIDRWLDTHNGSIEDHPQKSENLWLHFESSRFSAYWLAPITDTTDPLTMRSVRKLGDWEEMPRNTSHSGRFAHLLRPIEAAAS